MEEQKVTSKEVKMKPATKEISKGDSLIEELQKWDKDKLIQQVVQMNQQLYNQDNYLKGLRNQIAEMNQFISNKRMEYLFKVVEISNNYKSSDYPCFDRGFVEECLTEIQEALTIPKEEKDNEVNKES